MTTRILVHLRRPASSAEAAAARFTESVVDLLGGDGFSGDVLPVSCTLEGDRVVLARATSDKAGAPLRRPPMCPIKTMGKDVAGSIPDDVVSRGVAVGVVAVLESSDGRVLLTRRAKTMRTFPGVWVPPGGSVEAGDATLEETALRELREETGLDVGGMTVRERRLLCLWESVYPPFLEKGPPRRHHVVVYHHFVVDRDHHDLDEDVVLEPEEVDASAWLSPEHVDLMVGGDGGGVANPADRFKIKLLCADGTSRPDWSPASVLTARGRPDGLDFERISSGTVFALTQWRDRTKTSKSQL